MVRAISDLRDSAENASLEEWNKYLSSTDDEKPHIIQSLRDPLRKARLGSDDIVAVYGIYISGDKSSLVYYWHNEFRRMKWRSLDAIIGPSNFLEFGAHLCNVHEHSPPLAAVMGLVGEMLREEIPEVDKLLSGLALYWITYGNLKFVCVYRVSSQSSDKLSPKPSSSSNLLDAIAFHYDYFKLRSPVWTSTPMRYLFGLVSDSDTALKNLHLNPRCFVPNIQSKPDSFLWPWQRCMVTNSAEGKSVSYAAIPTTSLVFDLRKSTVAMEQLRSDEAASYSHFIKKVIDCSRSKVFQYGGFFDKETGDGLVGHFVSFKELGNSKNSCLPERRAFDCAVEIIRSIAEICEEFQSKLTFGVDALGASIGIHTDEAVWISEHRQIRAIGQSVILASRLCNEAEKRSIFISNSEFQRLSPMLPPSLTYQFKKSSFQGKEYSESADLYGYSIKIEDDA